MPDDPSLFVRLCFLEVVVKGNPTRERGMDATAIGVPRLRFGFPCLTIHHYSFFFVF